MVEICCVISGSFTKAKPQIDRARECFESYHIKVLSPDVGGLYKPSISLVWSEGAYPLRSEQGISEVEAKKRHLLAIQGAKFLYICAPDGYIGDHVSFELGVAIGFELPIYSDEPIGRRLFDDSSFGDRFLDMIEVKSPEDVAKIWTKDENSNGLLLPS